MSGSLEVMDNVDPSTNNELVEIASGDGSGNKVNVTASNEVKALVTPLTNSSVIKVQVQDNAGTGLTSTLLSTKQGLDVNVINSFASGVADKTTFTYGTTVENSIGGVFQDTSPTLTAGQQGAVRLTSNRAFHVNLRDASGNEKLGQLTSANSVPVVIASDQTLSIQGNIASGATDSGNPVKIGGVYNTSLPTLTNGQRGDIQLDQNARMIVSTINQQTTLPAFDTGGTYDTPNSDPFGNMVQISETSVFARWGNFFHVSTNAVTTGVAAETAYFYLKNANANTKSVRLSKAYLSSPSAGNTVYRFYMDPTVTVNGTSLTIVGARQTNQNTTTVTAFRLPTVTANGTVFKAINVPTGASITIDFNCNKWIEANHGLLITSAQSLLGGFSGVDLEFIEE